MVACAECGANLALVGRMHRCIPRAQPAAAPVINDMANSVANTDKPDTAMANAPSTYKYRDPAARRAYQRDLMQGRRKKAKNATSQA